MTLRAYPAGFQVVGFRPTGRSPAPTARTDLPAGSATNRRRHEQRVVAVKVMADETVAAGIGVACPSRLAIDQALRSKQVIVLRAPFLALGRTLWRLTRIGACRARAAGIQRIVR
jgi:hypothetical protein